MSRKKKRLLQVSKRANIWSKNYIEYGSNGDRNKTLSIEEYLNTIRPYSKDIIYYLKTSDMQKVQLTIAINFTSSKDTDEKCVMHSKSHNIEIMIMVKQIKLQKTKLYQSLLCRYQIGLETSMKGTDFIFDCVHLLYYKCHKINPNSCESYIHSPDRINIKKQQLPSIKRVISDYDNCNSHIKL